MYAVFLLGLSIIGTTAIANTNVYDIFWASLNTDSTAEQSESESAVTISTATEGEFLLTQAPMVMTIIQGANEEVVCPNDGSTLAKFFLCGTSDIRTISLSVSGSSYEWTSGTSLKWQALAVVGG